MHRVFWSIALISGVALLVWLSAITDQTWPGEAARPAVAGPVGGTAAVSAVAPGTPQTVTFLLPAGVTCDSDWPDDGVRECLMGDVTVAGGLLVVSGPTVTISNMNSIGHVTVTVNSQYATSDAPIMLHVKEYGQDSYYLSAYVTYSAGEKRRIVYIQGIHSQSRCESYDGSWNRAPSWLNPYLVSHAAAYGLSLELPAFFSYSGDDCGASGTPDYEKYHTCGREADIGSPGGIPGLALDLKSFINQMGDTKVTVVGHSMGGLITAYLVGLDPGWANQHIASVVTFDSPLRGLPLANYLGLTSGLVGPCHPWDPTPTDMVALLPCLGSVVSRACGAAKQSQVPFYTIDAVEAIAVQLVPSDRTTLSGERDHLAVFATHTSVWDNAANDKKQFVLCAMVRAWNCNTSTTSVQLGGVTSLTQVINPFTNLTQFVITWPGSTIEATLIAPNGTQYGPFGEAAAAYRVGDTYEIYEVSDPMPGEWTVELAGVDVPPEGEPVTVASVTLERSDSTPPETTASVDPADPDGPDGNYLADVSVSLSAVDPGAGDGSPISGIAATTYVIDDGTWIDYSTPFSVGGDGSHVVQFFSEDVAGNAEAIQAIEITIGEQPAKGDVNCDGAVDVVDTLQDLRYGAGLRVSQNGGCPLIGSEYNSIFGDMDCDEDVDAHDALWILLHVAAVPINLPQGCAQIGST